MRTYLSIFEQRRRENYGELRKPLDPSVFIGDLRGEMARQQTIWCEGSKAVASDSTHFRSYDQNIFTEWHSRYGGRGILIYWHVERGSMVVHSKTLRASASEVHAMVEGAIRHETTMKVEGNYVDSHGQSEIGFGITRLLVRPRPRRVGAGHPGAAAG